MTPQVSNKSGVQGRGRSNGPNKRSPPTPEKKIGNGHGVQLFSLDRIRIKSHSHAKKHHHMQRTVTCGTANWSIMSPRRICSYVFGAPPQPFWESSLIPKGATKSEPKAHI